MRNLVLGSEGFVGAPLVRFLEDRGEDVVRFDIKRHEQEDLRRAQLDLTGIDRVYILAWDVGGAKYLYAPESQLHQLDWNLALLRNTLPQLRTEKVRFLFVSSHLAEAVDTVYGVTKRLGEVWTRLLGGVSARLWNVYGPLETPSPRTHVVSDFVHQALQKGRIEMLTTGEEKRQFIHIDDVCTAFHRAIDLNFEEIYDISSYEWVRVRDVAQIIAEETGAVVVPGDKRWDSPALPMKGRMPGWLPEVDLRQGLGRMIKEFRGGLGDR